MANILWGNVLAEKIKDKLKEEVTLLVEQAKRLPKLVVILVGKDPASEVYVANKQKACLKVGILTEIIRYDEKIVEHDLISKIEELNYDDSVDGILVQMPVPKHIDSDKVINTILVEKDVDGLNPMNVGLLQIRKPCLIPCTPLGILELIKSVEPNIAGKNAVIVGRSNLVGLPTAQLLLQENATVTICHSYTNDLKSLTRQADILIAAVGQPGLITKDHVKPHAIIIDVGTKKQADGKLHGDVLFDEVEPIVDHITPMPKGVGPMTITMLMKNTLKAYYQRESKDGI